MDKSKKGLITLLVILVYLVIVTLYPFPQPSSKIEFIAIDVVKLIFLTASIHYYCEGLEEEKNQEQKRHVRGSPCSG